VIFTQAFSVGLRNFVFLILNAGGATVDSFRAQRIFEIANRLKR
jgi:hypothetical protein